VVQHSTLDPEDDNPFTGPKIHHYKKGPRRIKTSSAARTF